MRQATPFAALVPKVDGHFGGAGLSNTDRLLAQDAGTCATDARAHLASVSPLAAAPTVELLHRPGDAPACCRALEMEDRFAHCAQKQADLPERIRAKVIDRDRVPAWHHVDAKRGSAMDVARMPLPLGPDGLRLD